MVDEKLTQALQAIGRLPVKWNVHSTDTRGGVTVRGVDAAQGFHIEMTQGKADGYGKNAWASVKVTHDQSRLVVYHGQFDTNRATDVDSVSSLTAYILDVVAGIEEIKAQTEKDVSRRFWGS